MNDDDKIAAIASLDSRLVIVEGELLRIRDKQSEICEDLHIAEMNSGSLASEVKWIKETLIEMNRKKMRAVDVALIILMLFVGAGSLMAQLQNNQIQKEVITLSKAVNP